MFLILPEITRKCFAESRNYAKLCNSLRFTSNLADKYWKYKYSDKINSSRQIFKTFFVLDFEATCDNNVKLQPQEIIEFPCLKLNGETLEVEAAFHEYVRPEVFPELTPFCIQLTGISQDVVNKSAPFTKVWNNFTAWFTENKKNAGPYVFVSCGNWDFKYMLPQQLAVSGLDNIEDCHSWIDLKKTFAKGYGRFPFGLKDMLRTLDIPHFGKLHSGIDDCTNIANVVRKMIEDKIVLDITDRLKQP